MDVNTKTRLFRAGFVGMILILMTLMLGVGPDAEAASKNRKKSNVVVTGETPVHSGYPRLFDNVGTLDRLTSDSAVISDSSYVISNSTSYHIPGRHYVLRSHFHAGDIVGCIFAADGEIESMWLILRKGP
jgi:hypothetical protein